MSSPNVERVLGVSAEDVLNDPWAIGHAEYITGYEVRNKGLIALALEPMEAKRINRKTGRRIKMWVSELPRSTPVSATHRRMVSLTIWS